VLTFDDGYRDAYTAAWPVLKKYGFGATFFVITDLIDNPRYLTKDQIRELAANDMEIGDHSASHSELPALSRAQLQREIVESKAVLERILGGPVLSFCYPSGHNSLAVRQVVQAAGYASAVTVDPGVYRGKGDRLQIPRVRVYGGITLADFARAIGEAPPR
jgi:peptidoglycan/xylan/chitin deacetylase (PgdA/CDA1 family)